MRSSRAADRDGCVPDDFYSTTNMRTHVRVDGRWLEVERQRMDAVIVLEDSRAVCRKLREIKVGDRVVCGLRGLRVSPEFRERDRTDFTFMSNEISSERRVEASVARIAVAACATPRPARRRIVFVAGPVVVHTGGTEHFIDLIRRGWVDVVLAGNALAVHDAELAMFGTSLGVDQHTGVPVLRRPPPSHARHQRHQPRRRDQARRRIRRAAGRRDGRMRPRRCRLCACRQHSRRRPDRGYVDRHHRGPGSLCRGARARPAWSSCCRRCCMGLAWGTCCRPGFPSSASTSIRPSSRSSPIADRRRRSAS